MTDYRDKYLKYKMKYLALKDKMEGSGFSTPVKKKRRIDTVTTQVLPILSLTPEQMLTSMINIYLEFEKFYSGANVFLGGSMALYLLGTIHGNLPESYPYPNDIDIYIGLRDQTLNNFTVGSHRYERDPNKYGQEDSYTLKNYDITDGFNSIDVIFEKTSKFIRHHVVNYKGIRIKILSLDTIEEFYEDDNFDNKNDIKIKFIQKLKTLVTVFRISEEKTNGPPRISRRSRRSLVPSRISRGSRRSLVPPRIGLLDSPSKL